MHSPRSGRAMLLWGIAACLSTAACGDGGGGDGDHNVELQVGYGLVADEVNHHYTVRVTTPRDTQRKLLPSQDGPNPSSWARFDVLLNEGELVEIALENQNGVLASRGTCTVHGAVTLEYARAFIAGVQFFNGQYLECADGLQQ